MKSIHALLILIFFGVSSHAMEHGKQIEILPDYKKAHNLLLNDYKNYLKNQLEIYKKADVNMDTLVAMSHKMTKGSYQKEIVYARDDQYDHFIHIAINKQDLSTVQWLYAFDGGIYPNFSNSGGKSPLCLCIDQLSPVNGIQGGKNVAARQIFDVTLEALGKNKKVAGAYVAFSKYKEMCLKNIIALQLKYKKNLYDFVVAPESLASLVSRCRRNQLTVPAFISTFYKAAIDESNGDTFTHILVAQNNPDELFEWLKQERGSFEKNKSGLTPLDVALEKCRHFTQDVSRINADKDSYDKLSCCVFILLNYIRLKKGTPDNTFGTCCDRHVFTA